MAPKPEVVQVENQATGFAEQFMDQLMSGSAGYATPLQRNIGSAWESLIAQGPQYFDNSKGFDALREQFGLTSSTGRANLAEKFSIGGSRYGTPAATGIGRYQAQSDADMNAVMAQLAQGSFESGQNRWLSSLGGAGGFSEGALGPLMQMALAGIVNPAVFMKENPWMSGLKGLGGLAGAAGSIATGGGLSGLPGNIWSGVGQRVASTDIVERNV